MCKKYIYTKSFHCTIHVLWNSKENLLTLKKRLLSIINVTNTDVNNEDKCLVREVKIFLKNNTLENQPKLVNPETYKRHQSFC